MIPNVISFTNEYVPDYYKEPILTYYLLCYLLSTDFLKFKDEAIFFLATVLVIVIFVTMSSTV